MKIKIFIGVIVCVTLIIVAVVAILNAPSREERTERHFVRDYELLLTVAQFLTDSSYEHVSIWSDDMENGEMVVFGRTGRTIIRDVAVTEALNELRRRGYGVITKRDNSNTITFQRWSTRLEGWGMAFSIDGNEPSYRSIVMLTPLSKPDWYFYVTR